MKKIGVFYNPNKTELKQLFQQLESWSKLRKIALVIFHDLPEDILIFNLDLAICLGGDGTMLRFGRYFAGTGIPILGVNLGRLGFLTEINKNELVKELNHLLDDNNFKIEDREIFDISILREGKVIQEYSCVNDISIKNSEAARIIDLDLFVDEEFVVTSIGDGLIISTPTGSTAYSLAAGGPIVSPDLSVYVISAICPHTLNLRPIVVSSSKNIKVKVVDKVDILLSVDGQLSHKLLHNDFVSLNKSNKTLKLLITHDYSYFKVLREKLSWGSR